MSSAFQLYDVLMAKAPVLILHEPDARYARRGPAEIVSHVRSMPLLEWARDVGWKASEARSPELFARTGFAETSPLLTTGGTSEEFDALTLHKFVEWVMGSRVVQGNDGMSAAHPFNRGLLICHDMISPTRGREPGFLRVVQSLGEVLGSADLSASAVFTTTQALPADHPLLTLCPQVRPLDDPWRRLGALLLQGARQLHVAQDEAVAQQILLPRTQGLTYAHTDLVLRMLLIQHSRFKTEQQRAWTPAEMTAEMDQILHTLLPSTAPPAGGGPPAGGP